MNQKHSKFTQGYLDEVLTKSCPHCRKEIPIKAVKCMYCAEWVKEKDTNSCQHCNKEIPIKAVKCMHCGNWIKETLKPDIEKRDETKLCQYCESRIHSKALKCKYCGEWVEKKTNIKDFTDPAKNAIIGEAVREGIRRLREWR